MDRTDLPADSGGQYHDLYIFPLVVLLVFLVLAAQYESLALPLAVIMIMPMVAAVGDPRREAIRRRITISSRKSA